MIARSTAIFTILAVLALLMPALYANMLQFQQAVIKLRAEERLEAEKQTTISIATKDLRWHEAEREIVVSNQLMDVTQVIVRGDSTLVTGVFDVDETAIEAALQALTDSPEDANLYVKIGERLQTLLSTHQANSLPTLGSIAELATHDGHYAMNHLLSAYLPADAPPPDLLNAYRGNS